MNDFMSKKDLTGVDAVDAFRVKDQDARSRLAKDFIAFIQAPLSEKKSDGSRRRRKIALGHMVYGTSGETARYANDNFVAYMVGNPPTQVQATYAAIGFFCRQINKVLDVRDARAKVVVHMLRTLHKAVLEDKDEPRAQAVETLFFDFGATIHWCGYDGAENTVPLEPGGSAFVLRGCYDDLVRRGVEDALRQHLLESKPTKRVLTKMVDELKSLTGLEKVGYSPFIA